MKYSVEAFSRNLSKIRKDKMYSRKELSKATGIDTALIYRYESCQGYGGRKLTAPQLSNLFKLAEVLDVTLDELCREQGGGDNYVKD